MNGAHPYLYARGPSPYNGLPSSFPPTNRLSPSVSGKPLNGPNPYPGQPPLSGPVQQPVPQSRIDPDMIPNVVRKSYREIKNIISFIKLLI